MLSDRAVLALARVLLDQGFESSFVSEALTQLLELSRRQAQVTLNGLGESKLGTARTTATLTLQSRLNPSYKVTTEALVLPRLTSHLPSRDFLEVDFGSFTELPLADPQFQRSAAIDLRTRLVAQNTTFGSIISGAINQASSRLADRDLRTPLHVLYNATADEALQDSLQRF